MELSQEDLQAFTELLARLPKLEELRRAILTEELLGFPQMAERRFAELAEAQKATAQTLSSLIDTVEGLRSALHRLGDTLELAEQRLSALMERTERQEIAMGELAQAMTVTEHHIARMADIAAHLQGTEDAELATTQALLSNLRAAIEDFTRGQRLIHQKLSDLLQHFD